jgi:hypothetical protein
LRLVFFHSIVSILTTHHTQLRPVLSGGRCRVWVFAAKIINMHPLRQDGRVLTIKMPH